MADFFFFTDTDLLNAQDTGGAFGPVIGFEDSKYRLCNMHKSSSDSAAYAICSGSVFIQEDASDSDLINLVLRPSKQASIDFPTIKYFIYKGIKKTSLISADGLEIAAAETNDLTQLIWDAQNAKNASFDLSEGNEPGTTMDIPSANSLGINYQSGATDPYVADDTDLLSIPFFKTGLDFQIPVVNGGFNIGTFDKDGFGLQIVFETIKNRPTFLLSRQSDHILEIPALVGGEPQSEVFDHWNNKEEILQYLDSSAFYGNFYSLELQVKSSVEEDFTVISGDDVYGEILNKYSNKNRVYLDIRGELNHGFGYFGNYGTDLNMAFTDGGILSTVDMYRANWPILIIDNDFPLGNTSESNTIKLTLPKGDMETPLLIAKMAKSDDSFPNFIKGKRRFIRLEHDEISTYNLNTIKLYTPNYITTDTTPISAYFHLKYVRKLIDIPSIIPNDNQILQKSGYDHLFYPFQLKENTFNITGVTQIEVFREEVYVDLTMHRGESFLAYSGIGLNLDGSISLFAYSVAKNIGCKVQSLPISIAGGQYANGDHSMDILSKKIGAYNVDYKILIDSVERSCDTLEINFNKMEDLFISKRRPNLDEFVFINLTAEQFTLLESIKDNPINGFLASYPITIAFEAIESGISEDLLEYAKFEITLVGYKYDPSTDRNIVNNVETGIEFYQLAGPPNPLAIKY